MSMTQTVLQGADTASQAVLYCELRAWRQEVEGDGGRWSHRTEPGTPWTPATPLTVHATALRKAKRSAASLIRSAMVHSCYEAGRDGLVAAPLAGRARRRQHRCRLSEHRGEPARQARPRPTGLMAASCWRCCCATTAGERVWSVLREPTAPEQEDARRSAPRAGAAGARSAPQHIESDSARCWCCTTCDRTSSLVGATGHAWWDKHCEGVPVARAAARPRSSARSHAWRW